MLTQEYVKECFDYNFTLGKLYWKQRPLHHFRSEKIWRTHGHRNLGKPIICLQRNRLVVRLNNQNYQAYRIMFLWFHGYIPKLVAHWDGDESNNKISNLLDSSNRDNSKFQKFSPRGLSGIVGISLNQASKQWQARITVNNKPIYLGSFKHKEEAIKARKEAEVKYGFHKNHGKEEI